MEHEDFVSKKKRNRNIEIIVSLLLLVIGGYAIFGYLLRTEDPTRGKDAIGKVLERKGDMQVVRNFDNIPLEKDMVIKSGDFIRTRNNGRFKIRYFDDDTKVTVTENSNIVFNALKNGKRMNLGKGKAHVWAPDQPENLPLSIITPSAEVTIKKEAEIILIHTGMNSELEVKKGEATFRRFTDGKTHKVSKGQKRIFEPAGPEKIEFEG